MVPLVYAELRAIARQYLASERPNHTLQATALVNEAYLRLRGQREADFSNRQQLIGLAAQMMRRALVDHANSRSRRKRGGGLHRILMDSSLLTAGQSSVDFADLDRALEKLAKLDLRLVEVVELRFFGGLSIEETAEVQSRGTATVVRDWAAAKLFLARELKV